MDDDLFADDPFAELLEWDYDTDPVRPEDANRLLWRIRRAEDMIAANQAMAQIEVGRVLTWQHSQDAAPQAEIQRAKRALEGWARANHRENRRQVTWNLPQGTLKLLAPRYILEVDDDEAACKTLLDMDEQALVKQEPSVRARELKKLVVGKNTRQNSGVRLRPEPQHVPVVDFPDQAEMEPVPPDVDYFDVILDGVIIPGVHVELAKDRKFTQQPPPAGDEPGAVVDFPEDE